MEKSFSEKKEALVAQKERIAQEAATWVQDDDSILLTPGTTNMMLAQRLVDKKRLTIVTNAVNIAVFLSQNSEHDVMLIGGRLRRKSQASVGTMAQQSLQQIRVDKLFLGVDGIDIHDGLTTPNLEEASVNRTMMAIAGKIIVVADHSKFGKVTFSHIASLDRVDVIITDCDLPQEIAEKIIALGMKVKRV